MRVIVQRGSYLSVASLRLAPVGEPCSPPTPPLLFDASSPAPPRSPRGTRRKWRETSRFPGALPHGRLAAPGLSGRRRGTGTGPRTATWPSTHTRSGRKPRHLSEVLRCPECRPPPARPLIVLTVVLGVLLGTLLVTAFGQGATRDVSQALPGPSSRLLPVGPPTPLTVALHSGLRIQLPIAQTRVTAIGYHSSGDGALPLRALGRQGNEGALSRLAHKIFGGGGGGFVYYQLSGGETAVLDVGAVPGTDVYAPVDGTIVGISDYVLNGRAYGSRIDIQPSAAPSLVVSLTHLRPDPALSVGSMIAASSTKVGRILDLSGVEKQALGKYTQDAGNHVAIELRPAATLTFP